MRNLSGWYVASALVLLASISTAVALPPVEECTALPGILGKLDECGAEVVISPAFVVVVGVVIASFMALIGFLRSARS